MLKKPKKTHKNNPQKPKPKKTTSPSPSPSKFTCIWIIMQQTEYIKDFHKVQRTDSSPTSHMRVAECSLFEHAVIQA